jgi:hypothetical protein
MSIFKYKTASQVSAAVAALGSGNRLLAMATSVDDGYELAIPDKLDDLLKGLDITSMQLSVLKQQRIEALTLSCSEEIVGGYTSSALGAIHVYPSKITDQINMMGSASASLYPGNPDEWSTPFWCANDEGVWAFRAHSATQIQATESDRKAHILRCQSRLEQLSAQVMAAKTANTVDAIVWL